jgi:O-antigen/teichoic acid export membrane protein
VRRLLRAVPPGTLAVGCGLAVLGAASYVHLAAAGHTLDEAASSSVSVLWSLVFSLGIGLFMPVEQEVARVVAARPGNGVTPVLRTGAVLAGGLLAILCVCLVAGAGPLADRLFEGDRGMVWALCGAFLGLAASHLTRGVLSGLGMFGWYGTQLGLDGGLRIVIAGGLWLAGVRSALAFALVLAIAPLAAVLLTLPPVVRALRPGVPAPLPEVARGLALLIVSSLLAQVVVNIAVINLKLLEPGEHAFVFAMLSALVLVRVPLFVFASIQASLLPALARASAAADTQSYRRLLGRALAVVGLLGLAGAVPAVAIGPWLVRVLLGAADVLTRVDFAWLAVGTLAYMIALVLGQAVLARGWHGVQAMGWLVGTLVLLAITFGPGEVRTRVELAYAIGSAAVVPVLLPFAWRPHRGGATPEPTPAVSAGIPVD